MRKTTNRIMKSFINGFFPPVLILLALLAGAVALWLTPREEDPQIVVPMADVLVSTPGLSATQVDHQVVQPLEKLLTQIDGVEDVYSMSMRGGAQVIVRFYVGENREAALVRLYNKIYSHQDQIPPQVSNWIIKPVEIDDVPIVVAALYSTDAAMVDGSALRRLAEQASSQLQGIRNTNKVDVVGGNPRIIEIAIDSAAMSGRYTTIDDIARAFAVSNQRMQAGTISLRNRVLQLESGQFFQSADDIANSVVNVVNGQPVYLKDVANLRDGAQESSSYTWFTPSLATQLNESNFVPYPAVFISVAKQKGSNAVRVADEAVAAIEEIVATQFPPEVEMSIIRNYGETANDKVGNLVTSLGLAILTVVVFVGVFLNWRSALVVGIAIPISYGATLAMDLAFGYTINRVTLFALILALGLIVDDPIASIDNIERFLKRKGMNKVDAIVLAMAEIRSALLMSTVAIVIVFTPMFFITGMMGPYMAPLAFNVPVSVIFSTVVAFFITPWLAKKILKVTQNADAHDVQTTLLYRFYRRALEPILRSRLSSWGFLALVFIAFIGAAILPATRAVPLKLLPYDNKDEFQLILNMPEGTPVALTNNALLDFSDYLRHVPEVVSISGFAGTASPMDFNGMVRHYFMRSQPHQGELRVVLAEKNARQMQSHEMVMRMRDDLEAIAARHGAHIQLVEMPPGPPVIATLVAEVYGQPHTPYEQLIASGQIVADRLAREPFVYEVDTSAEHNQKVQRFEIDREKAALSGIAVDDINRTLHAANKGMMIGELQLPYELNPLPVVLRLPEAQRDQTERLTSLMVRGMEGITKQKINGRLEDAGQPVVVMSELGQFVFEQADQPIYRKNLKPVVYVYAEAVGRVPAEVVADVMSDQGKQSSEEVRSLAERHYFSNGGDDGWQVTDGIEVEWSGEGEWKITLDVFRDLGIAYGAALLGVFIVMVLQTGLPAVSGIIMLAIPLTIIGIMPGFWLLNQLGTTEIAGIPNSSLFTATAMIGMIALAGIVVRNSLVLIEFIHQSLRKGMVLQEALIQAGAVRMRPILLTAGTTLLGNIVITLDPIFNGLAWAVIFGISASTLFTLLVIPVVYHLAYANHPGHGLPIEQYNDTAGASE